MRLLTFAFITIVLLSNGDMSGGNKFLLFSTASKCPLEISSPFCKYDKSLAEFNSCTLEDKFLYLNSTRHDYISYMCPPEASDNPKKPDQMELVASKGIYRKDFVSSTLYDDWDVEMPSVIRKYYGDWAAFALQLNYRENPAYAFKTKYMKMLENPTLDGLDINTLKGIYFSASKQFGSVEFGLLGRHFYEQMGEPGFVSVAASVKAVVVDLRDESHFLVNGLPVYLRCKHNWANRYLYATPENLAEKQRIEQYRKLNTQKDHDEMLRKRHLETCGGQIRYKDSKHDTTYEFKPLLELMTEAEQIDNMNGFLPMGFLSESKLKSFEYCRIRVADHACPSVETLNDFVDIVLRLHSIGKQEKFAPWFHFHCNGGKGRSTFFLTAYDMLANAHNTSYDVIMARQKALNAYPKLGLVYSSSEIGSVEGEDALEQAETNKRTKTLELFYAYCRGLGPILAQGQKAPKVFSIPLALKVQFKEEDKTAKARADASVMSTSFTVLSTAFLLALL